MRKYVPVALLLSSGLIFSACSSSSATYARSSNCQVSATNVDLAGCNLSHRNLSGDDLQGDNLSHANLNGTNLDNANLQGANLAHATYVKAKTNELTICVNAEVGPCTKPGLRSPSNADAAQGQ
jgi:uncharacterized protein YjbI with pentapeptide repeats